MKIRTSISDLALPALVFVLGAVAASPVVSQSPLVFPDTTVRHFEEVKTGSSYRLPVGAFKDGFVSTQSAEGKVTRQVWRTPSSYSDTLGILVPLRDQLKAAGYNILFECEAVSCGGFDFRFGIDVVSEPEMHVDLGDYRFLSAQKADDEAIEHFGVLVSKSPEQGFIQITRVEPRGHLQIDVAQSTKQNSAETIVDPSYPEGDLVTVLAQKGSAVLEGLRFANGKSELDDESASGLSDLVTYLSENPEQAVVLVGHTDASGSLERNVKLSKERANSVMRRLVDTYGIDPGRLTAEGVGYLSPRANNATKEGRERNRRVEVVLTLE